jgi:hypothetical protein
MPAIGGDVPNLFYVLGLPLTSMFVLGVIAVALYRGLGKLLP